MKFCMNKCFPYASLSLLSFGNSFTFKATLYLVKYSIFLWVSYLIDIKGDIWASQAALVVKNQPASAGDIIDAGSTPGSGRSPGGGHGYPLQYSWDTEWDTGPPSWNTMDRGAWKATVYSVLKTWT